ncbi:hypothetical protein ABIB80_007745 [Bradyrhizobium sp. i1.15.2]|uniref:hypothetical protein n=1 Tax=Bradyrhizobium sp. i1.15.2 TaxID=3156362 RepID=UPI003399104F
MPFLFVDQLDVQVPQTTALSDVATGRVRVIWASPANGRREVGGLVNSRRRLTKRI